MNGPPGYSTKDAGPIAARSGELMLDDNQILQQTKEILLTQDELLRLGSSPVELIPAPGGGKAIVVHSYTLSNLMSVQFDMPNPAIKWGPGGLEVAFGSDPNFLTSTENVMWSNSPGQSAHAHTGIENEPIILEGTDAAGPIATTVLDDGGSGYAVNDTGTINGGDSNAAYVVDAVDGGGAVTDYHLTANGADYAPSDHVATTATSGVGTGFQINIETVTPVGEGQSYLSLTFSIINVH